LPLPSLPKPPGELREESGPFFGKKHFLPLPLTPFKIPLLSTFPPTIVVIHLGIPSSFRYPEQPSPKPYRPFFPPPPLLILNLILSSFFRLQRFPSSTLTTHFILGPSLLSFCRSPKTRHNLSPTFLVCSFGPFNPLCTRNRLHFPIFAEKKNPWPPFFL